MKNRKTKRIVAGISFAAFEEAMANYAGAEMHKAAIMTKLDAEMTRIKEKYKDELINLQSSAEQAFELIETYCREQKMQLFNKRRTMHTNYGAVGFRLGMPKLTIIPGGTWTDVLPKLKEQLPGYVRITEEPAKDLLLAHRNKDAVAPVLSNIGLQVVQDELFFIELNKIRN